jgi:hypothetical protein
MNSLLEVNKPKIEGEIVVYAGRFQPFHRGHNDAYERLVSEFGSANVYIATSNDTSSKKSPFSFSEKKEIATKMFGIPSSKFVKVSNPYRPVEILKKYDGQTIAYIAAVGEKDATRLQGKYFKPYRGKAGYGYDEIGYTFPIPAEENPISGTDVRNGLGSNDKEKAKKFFLKAYPKFDKGIFKMITTKLNEGFPGGIGVGLTLPGGYINGAPTGSVDESDNTKPSSEMRPEPHPTRHNTEHPSDEPNWYKKDELYDPINEIIERYITNQMFEEFAKEYFGEASNKALDVDISYTNSKGQQKKIKARNALRLPKEHPAHIQAAKIVGPDDAPVNEPKKKTEPKTPATQLVKPVTPGQPTKTGQPQQGKIDKEKSPVTPNKTGQEQTPPPEQKIGGAELKSNAEKSDIDKIKEKALEIAKEAKKKCENIIKDFSEEEQHDVHETTNPHSETRKSWTQKIGDFVSNLPKNIAEKVYEVAKQKYHQLKNTGRGLKSLALSTMYTGKPQFGWFKDKDGQYKYSATESKRQRKACISTLKDVAIIGASVVVGGAIASASGAAVAGKGIGGVIHAATHGAAHSVSSAGGFAAHAAIDFAKHCGLEAVGLAAGAGHGEAVVGATGMGLGHMALKGMGLMEEVDDTKAHGDMFIKLVADVVKKMETFEPNPQQLLKTLESYKKQKEVTKLKNFTSGLNENLSETKQQSIQHFVEFATKRLKLKEQPKISLVAGREFAEVKTSLGGFDPVSKEIYVATEGRLTADILRTLAHEMVHRKQDELGLVSNPMKDGADGSPIENQAHAVAGILMREYGRINKQIYNEDINIDVDKGDTVLMGKFKNKKVQVKDIGKDDYGMPTINGKKATTFRLGQKGQNIYEMGNKDVHFINIIKLYRDAKFRKRINAYLFGKANMSPNANAVARELRNMGYDDITKMEKELNIQPNFDEQIKELYKDVENYIENYLDEVSGVTIANTADVPDGSFITKGKKRKLDSDKSEDWYKNGGYTQTEFPKADAIFGDEAAEERTITYRIKNLPDVDYVETEFIKEGLLLEGGAYGHMSHPFDDMDLTFGDLKNIITSALNGELGVVREKTDGQALAISWKNGRLIAARNKGHLSNAGANALGIEGVASKFQGRGGLTDAYNFAMRDLSAAISSLSQKQREKIFDEGKNFMNIEVIWPTSVNVIPYGQALLVFHNCIQYNEKGVATGQVDGAENILAGMIKRVNADVQSKYTIQGPPITNIPKSDDLSSKQGKYLSKLNKLQNEFGLKDSDNVADYHQSWWDWWIESKAPTKIDKLTKESLIRRWAFGEKSFRLNTISDEELQKWAIQNDKVNVAKQQKDNIRPFEELFLGVGADVLEFVGSVLTVHPDNAIRAMKSKLKSVAAQVRNSGSPAQIQKLKTELERLNQLGGIEKIVANEGLVFVYNGKTYKLTGTFAPLNQILGIFYS